MVVAAYPAQSFFSSGQCGLRDRSVPWSGQCGQRNRSIPWITTDPNVPGEHGNRSMSCRNLNLDWRTWAAQSQHTMQEGASHIEVLDDVIAAYHAGPCVLNRQLDRVNRIWGGVPPHHHPTY